MEYTINDEVPVSQRFIKPGFFKTYTGDKVMFVAVSDVTGKMEKLVFIGYITKESFECNKEVPESWDIVVPITRKVKHIIHRQHTTVEKRND